MFIATLIATERLAKGEISAASDSLASIGATILSICDPVDGRAADIRFEGDRKSARAALEQSLPAVDIAVQPAENREKRLLISDMDSTMITVECIDELADYAGIKPKIAEITERAMLGELDFEEALRGRVALLQDLESAAIDQCLKERVEIMPGARQLVRTMRSRGAHTILVSGGFTRFAKPVAQAIGFESFHANVLAVKNNRLTGDLEGTIVDASRKSGLLASIADEHGIETAATLAVGDGANDIPMIEQAGLGVAYRAKPKAAAAADVAIRHNDLSALLYVQGIASDQWVEA